MHKVFAQNWLLAIKLARRDLRGGLHGFWILLTCLALGVAAIAIIGTMSALIDRSMAQQGRALLGGDVEFSVMQRQLTAPELDFLANHGKISTVAQLRAMAHAGEHHSLAEVKAVDDNYPLFGTLTLTNNQPLRQALDHSPGTPYPAFVEPELLARLHLKPGDQFTLGKARLQIVSTIKRESDRIADGFILAPRLMISSTALAATDLVKPGSLVRWRYRLQLPGTATDSAIAALKKTAAEKFKDSGWRIRSRDRAAPNVSRFFDRLAFFMTLVGLTALIVGGVGVANAVTSFMSRKQRTIAMLKCLGAPAHLIMRIYIVEILAIASLAIAVGLVLGAALPNMALALFGDLLPLPVSASFEIMPLLRAGLFGYLITMAFALTPLSRARITPATTLFREAAISNYRRPEFWVIAAITLILTTALALALVSFKNTSLTLWYSLAMLASFGILTFLALALMAVLARLPKSRSAAARFAIANLYRAGAPTASVVLSLGLGLTMFVSLALIDVNISRELRSGIITNAPSFFFLDVQNNQLDEFTTSLRATPDISDIKNAPMLRGRILKAGGKDIADLHPASDVEWAFRGDRGLTYAARLPKGSHLISGQWWPADYDGPPLVSFVDEIAHGAGLKIGDDVTINVLGRTITAKIANLRSVDWRSLQINFVMVFTPNTFAGAPHTHLVTAHIAQNGETKLLNHVARQYPAVTAIRVRDALQAVNKLLAQLLAAVRGANGVTLFSGILVLAGAMSAGLSNRIYDAVILKTYGATRSQLMLAFLLEFLILGTVTAVFAVFAGALASWAVIHFLMNMSWTFSLPIAAVTAILATTLTITAGLLATWRALTAKPARNLRM